MKTNRVLLVTVVVMTTLCAALVWSNVATSGRARELRAQLQARDAKIQELGATIDRANKMAADNGMGELLAQRDAEYEQLHEAYDKLKQHLAAASTVSVAIPAVTSAVARADVVPFGRRNMSAFLERIRQQDPQRYQEIVQRIQQRQQQAAQDYEDQMGTLAARAQNAATPEEADVLNQISDTLNKINQLRQDRAAAADLPPDQQQTQMQSINDQFRQAMQDLSTYREQERTIQYQQLADQLKLNDAEKQTLVQAIPQILKDTSYSPQRGPGGFGGFGGGTGAGATSSGSSGSSSSTTPSQQPSTTK
jgi:uncharacterized membrane protein YgcG